MSEIDSGIFDTLNVGVGIGFVSLGLALAATLLGRNLTRSILAAEASIVLLCIAMMLAGFGYPAVFLAMAAMLALVTVQRFGWMLVETDRDRMQRPDASTWLARVLGVALLGGGLLALHFFLMLEWPAFESTNAIPLKAISQAMGSTLFESWAGVAVLLGVALAAALLALLLLLSEPDGDDR